jgi:hypothetical protein
MFEDKKEKQTKDTVLGHQLTMRRALKQPRSEATDEAEEEPR